MLIVDRDPPLPLADTLSGLRSNTEAADSLCKGEGDFANHIARVKEEAEDSFKHEASI